MKPIIRAILLIGALLGASVAPAFAESAIFTLARTSLANVTDSAGLWQIETGSVSRNSVALGQYEIERRVSPPATDTQNTASEHITMFLFASKSGAPENIVVEGAYSYNTGALLGSVAAASTRYAYLRNADAAGVIVSGTADTTLTITWTGSYLFVFP